MKRIILTKVHPEIQLAHLYEHIFCNQLEARFYNANLFPSLDFTLAGKTYHGGIVYIELELYTERAIEVSRGITTLDLDVSKDIIANAASEILAEKEVPFASKGLEKVQQALIDLHKKEWVDIDDLASIDVKQIRRKAGPFYITEGKPLLARKLEVDIMIDIEYARSKRELMPLFLQLAWLVSATLHSILPGKYGVFSFDNDFKEGKEGMGIRNIFKIAHGSEIDAEEMLASIKEVLACVTDDGVPRLIDQLKSLSYGSDPSYVLPNIQKNYEDTLFLVGAKGWEELASEQNCAQLLNHTFVRLKFGRTTHTIRV